MFFDCIRPSIYSSAVDTDGVGPDAKAAVSPGCAVVAADASDANAVASSVTEDACDPEPTVQLSSGFYRGAPSPSARLLRASYSITSW